jgi:NAD(P)-dependent dehydrogenase (short-subunit alcohol dehydrogenase family)
MGCSLLSAGRWAVRLLSLFAFISPAAAAAAQAADVLDARSPTVLITGSNRGIGLALAQYYAGEGWNVIATCRDPENADELATLAKQHRKVSIEKLDVTDHAGIDALAGRYRDQPIDVLINNAALLGDLSKQKVGGLDYAEFEQVMNVNVFGPLKMSEAFADHVARSQQKKIVALTSGLGSLSLMEKMSGFYNYRMSKAALNMGFRGLRADLRNRGIIVGLVAPGMVETQLLADSGYRGKALKPAESAAGVAKNIAALTAADPGVPINVDGKPIPW